jgi:hypothetical protein
MNAKRCADRSRVSVSDHQYIMVGHSAISTATTRPRQIEPESRHSHAITTRGAQQDRRVQERDARVAEEPIQLATSIGKPGA